MTTDSATAQIRLVPIPTLAAGGRWRVEAMRANPEPLLLWFTKGQGRITIAGVTRGYTAHNAIFIPAAVMHGFEIGPSVFGSALFMGKDCPLVLPDGPRHLRIREGTAQHELNLLLDHVQREKQSTQPASDRALQANMGLISVWLERQAALAPSDARRAKPDATHRLAARYTALLERDFRSGAGVAAFAEALGVTPTHLTRCCKISCNRSAIELLQDRRIFEARKMLAETRMPVRLVGEALGFASAAYFTRAFQSMTGHSPSDFRRSTAG